MARAGLASSSGVECFSTVASDSPSRVRNRIAICYATPALAITASHFCLISRAAS
jgi:hypothetical protein